MHAPHGKDSLVTVVIPVYKTAAYLDTCVSSVVNQTYRNLQILLIDDGSPDACPQLCDAWAKRDPRITVIHKPNEGLGMARNAGMDAVAGDFLFFLDSDDCLLPDAVQSARERKGDIVIFGFQDVDIFGKTLAAFLPKTERQSYQGSAVQEVFLPQLLAGNAGLHPGVCWAMFSMELVRRANWLFPSEREIICEDIYALLALFPYVNSVEVLPKALYCYRKSGISLSRHYRPDRFEKAKYFYEQCQELCTAAAYPPAVRNACKEPFLALTITAMKQERGEALRKILDDPLLRRVLRETKPAGWKRRLLFWAVERKQYFLCRLLLTAQRIRK